MPQRNVASNFTFEQQRVEINNLAQDFWTQKGTVDTAAPTYLKHDGSNDFTGQTLAVPNAFTINANSGNGTVTISGNLDVTGTTTTVSSANLEVTDKNILIAKGSTSDSQADGAGITIDSDTDITFNFVDANDALVSSIGLEATTFLKAARGQFTGATSPTTGSGVEINAPDANTGQIIAYNRGTAAYNELRLRAASVPIYTGSTNALVGTFNSTGLSMESGANIAANTLTSTGDVSIGHTSPTARFDVRRDDTDGLIAEFHQSTGYGIDIGSSQADAYISSGFGQSFIFKTDAGSGQVERLRIKSDGEVLLHGTNATGANNTSALLPAGTTLNIHGTGSSDGISVVRYSGSYGAYGINIGRSRNDTFGTNTAVQSGDELGHVTFYGADGTNFDYAAQITGLCDGEVGTSGDATDMPGALSFRTTPEGSDSPEERLRITSDGFIQQKFTSNNSTTAEGLFINNLNNATGNNASLILSNDSGERKKAAIALIDTGNYGAGDLVFALDAADSGELNLTNDEKLRIKSNGYVGINEDEPQSRLDVRSTDDLGSIFRRDYGGVVANNASKLAMTIWGQDHDQSVNGTGTDQYGPMIGFGGRLDDAVPNKSDIRAGISYSYNGDLTFHAKSGSNSGLGITDGSHERLRIDGDTGNLLIGTNNTESYHNAKVSVSSNTAKLLELRVSGTGNNDTNYVKRWAQEFVRGTSEITNDILTLNNTNGNSHVVIELKMYAVAATNDQAGVITAYAHARRTGSDSGYTLNQQTPTINFIVGTGIAVGSLLWNSDGAGGGTLRYTTNANYNYVKYNCEITVWAHDRMNITFP